MNTPDLWPILGRLAAWLDQTNGVSREETGLRLLKVAEESGELAAAWIGYLGQNPRKGTTHTRSDVADELCDVAVAALVALHSITSDPAGHFAGKLGTIAALRLGDEPAPDAPDFFQPGRTYNSASRAATFRCITLDSHPNTGETRAIGWYCRNEKNWFKVATLDPDDWGLDGWTETTEDGGR